jgi:hypothetical protein
MTKNCQEVDEILGLYLKCMPTIPECLQSTNHVKKIEQKPSVWDHLEKLKSIAHVATKEELLLSEQGTILKLLHKNDIELTGGNFPGRPG